MSKNTTRKLAIGTAVAAAAGYVVGILTAPKAGKETRQDLKDGAAKGKAKVEEQLQRAQDELKSLYDSALEQRSKLGSKAKGELQDLLDKADDARHKAGEMLTAVRKGEADDVELQRTLNDAKRAIKHLRKYLSR
jgi:gas vesicle protein